MSSPDSDGMMSYSLYIEKAHLRATPKQSLDIVRPRTSIAWMADKNATHCFECGEPFTWYYTRKHHCRACARIFCWKCSSRECVLPRDIETYPVSAPATSPLARWNISLDTVTNFFAAKDTSSKKEKDGRKKERVCDRCYERISLIEQFYTRIIFFQYLDIPTVAKCSLLKNHGWLRTANIYKSIFHQIQYILPGYPLSLMQRNMLMANLEYIPGHSLLVIKALACFSHQLTARQIASLVTEHPSRECGCKQMLCSRKCRTVPTGLDVVELLDIPNLPSAIKTFIIDRLNTLSDEDLENILPNVVLALRYYSDLLSFLIQRSLASMRLRMSIFWMLVSFKLRRDLYSSYYYMFITNLDTKLGKSTVYNELLSGRNFFRCLSHLPNNEEAARLEAKDIPIPDGTLPHPFDPTSSIRRILTDKLHIKKSLTKPILIPLECFTSRGPVRKDMLIKKEDLIVDTIVLNIIRVMDHILKSEEGTDFFILTYRTISMGKECGVIEIVDNAETLYTIDGNGARNTLIHLLEKNTTTTVERLYDKFVKSTAAWCVISYLLGVGDRHLENIMLTSDGRLFHIDYGFILGEDTKIMAPAIRISTQILECLGGERGENFAHFKRVCIRIYKCLRRHSNLILSMLGVLSEDGLGVHAKFTKSRIREEILARFSPSEPDEYAESKILFKIEDSISSKTQKVLIDWAHYYSKEYSGLVGWKGGAMFGQ